MSRKRETIQAMREYCAYGAKALAPYLDARRPPKSREEHDAMILECFPLVEASDDRRAHAVYALMANLHWKQCREVWKAYRSVA